NRDAVAHARGQPIRHHSVPVRAQLRRRKSPRRVPFVLIDDDVDWSRYLLAGFEDMFDRREFIEFSAEDHDWTAKIGNPRSQIEALNEFIELRLVLVAGHEHETVFIGRRCLFENLGEAWLETRKADCDPAKAIGNRVGQDGRRVRAKASSK